MESPNPGLHFLNTLPTEQQAEIRGAFPTGIPNEVFERLAEVEQNLDIDNLIRNSFSQLFSRIKLLEEEIGLSNQSPVERIITQMELTANRRAYEQKKKDLERDYLEMTNEELQIALARLQLDIQHEDVKDRFNSREKISIAQRVLALNPEQRENALLRAREPEIRDNLERRPIGELKEILRTSADTPERVFENQLITEILNPNYVPTRVREQEQEILEQFRDFDLGELEGILERALADLDDELRSSFEFHSSFNHAYNNMIQRLARTALDQQRLGTTIMIMFRPYMEIFVPSNPNPVIVGFPLANVDPNLVESLKAILEQLIQQIVPENQVRHHVNPSNLTVSLTLNYPRGISPQELLMLLNRLRSTAIPLNYSQFSQYLQVTLELNVDKVENLVGGNYVEVDLRAIGFLV